MANFPKRTKEPTKSEKWFGDHNPWLGGKYDMFKRHDAKLGNCTNFVYCEMSRLIGKESKLPTFNAYCKNGKNWYDNCPKGYKKSDIPTLGGYIVLKHKGKNSGHVAIIQEIAPDYSWIVLSMSGWNSFLWKTKKVYKKNNYCYGDYELVGFVECPVKFDDNPPVPTGKHYPGEYPKLPTRGYFKKGDKGKEVVKLQQLLNWCNSCNLICDGIIGTKTITQVDLFESNQKLTIDGKFGKKCLAKAKEITK